MKTTNQNIIKISISILLTIFLNNFGQAQELVNSIINSDTEKALNLLENGASSNELLYRTNEYKSDYKYNSKNITELSLYLGRTGTGMEQRIIEQPIYIIPSYYKKSYLTYNDLENEFKKVDFEIKNKNISKGLLDGDNGVKKYFEERKKNIMWDNKNNKVPNTDNYTPVKITFDNEYNLIENKAEIKYPLFAAILAKEYDLAIDLINKGAVLNISQAFNFNNKFQAINNEEHYYLSCAGLLYHYSSYNSKSKNYTNKEMVYNFFTVEEFGYNKFYYTPLSLAFAHKYANPNNKLIDNLIDLMLKKGADPDYPTRIIYNDRYEFSEQFFPLNLMVNAITNNDLTSVEKLYNYGYDLNTYFAWSFKAQAQTNKYFKSNSLLELSEELGRIEITKVLLENGAKKNTDELTTESTALIHYFGEFIKTNPSKISPKQAKKYLAIYNSIKQGSVITIDDMVSIISTEYDDLINYSIKKIEKSRLYYVSKGKSPFLELMKLGKSDLIKSLIVNDSLNLLSGNYLQAAIEYAMIYGDDEMQTMLLNKCDTKLLNSTFYSIGNVYPHKEQNKKFVHKLGRLITNSILLCALKYGNENHVKDIIQRGVKANIKYPCLWDNTGVEFEIGLIAGKDGSLSLISGKAKEKINMLNGHNNIKYYKTEITPLLYYCMMIRDTEPNKISLLLNNRADVNYTSPISNVSSVYYASNFESLQLLCENNSTLNNANYCKAKAPTALWNWIAYKPGKEFPNQQPEGVRLLIENGADPKIQGFDSKSREQDFSFAKYFKSSRNYINDKERTKRIKSALKN